MCKELNSNEHSHIEKKNNRAFYRTRGFKINRERYVNANITTQVQMNSLTLNPF